MVSDRPTVFADALHMPFHDKAFDFVIASHILEHISRPEEFIRELMRVGKAGYIETPNIFLERLSPYPIHVLEVMDSAGKLHIRKKPKEGSDDFLARLRLTSQHAAWSKFFYATPQMFHVRYFWRDKIDYQIDNPEEPCTWSHILDDNTQSEVLATYSSRGWRGWGLRALRRYYAWRNRRQVDWSSILACPNCHQTLHKRSEFYVCKRCKLRYRSDPHPDFLDPIPDVLDGKEQASMLETTLTQGLENGHELSRP